MKTETVQGVHKMVAHRQKTMNQLHIVEVHKNTQKSIGFKFLAPRSTVKTPYFLGKQNLEPMPIIEIAKKSFSKKKFHSP